MDVLYAFFYALEPPALRHAEADAREAIVRCRNALPPIPQQTHDTAGLEGMNGFEGMGDVALSPEERAKVAQAAANLAEWLTGWLECVRSCRV